MALSVGTTKESLAQNLSTMGSWIAAYTNATTEATGGSYARKQTTWSAGTAGDGIYSGSQVEIDVPAGTYTHVAVFAASTGGSAIEVIDITDQVFASAGKLLVTPTITVV